MLENWANERKAQLSCVSFIQTVPIKELKIPKTDWVFFNSPKGLMAYMNAYQIQAKKIGVYGKGTLKAAEKHQLKVDFIGDYNKEPFEIAKKFRSIVPSKEIVLFPISQRSKRSISSEFHPDFCLEMITYLTELTPVKFEQEFDIFIFTSPSNLEAYLIENKITASSTIIAFGKTTAQAVKQQLGDVILIILDSPTERALIKTLEKLL